MKGRILILNDEDGARSLLRAILEREGYDCFATGTDEYALEILRAHPIDLIIQDMHRGGGQDDGCKFARVVKTDPQLQDIPIVIISGARENKAADLFREAGISFEETVAGYLLCPFDHKAVIALIESVVLRHDKSAKTIRK